MFSKTKNSESQKTRAEKKLTFFQKNNFKTVDYYIKLTLGILVFMGMGTGLLFAQKSKPEPQINKKKTIEAPAPVDTSERGGNRSDRFLAGQFVPLINGTDRGRWFWDNPLDYLFEHGYDWIWVHGASTRNWIQGLTPEKYSGPPCQEKDLEKIRRLASRARILWEVHFWNELPGGMKDNDWYTLSKEPEKLKKVLAVFKKEVDFAINLFHGYGKNKLYSVVISEEEPWRCERSRGIGPNSYDPKPAEFYDACVNVYKQIYQYLKDSYPGLRVAHGFYPMEQIVSRIPYDDVVMDCYPQYPSEKVITQQVKIWKKLYKGNEENTYILLWGAGVPLNRIAYRDKIFADFLAAGFKNLGWFDTGRWTSRYQSILESKVDIDSPNTFQKENLVEDLQSVDRKLKATIAILNQCPKTIQPKNAQAALEEERSKLKKLLSLSPDDRPEDFEKRGRLLAKQARQHMYRIISLVQASNDKFYIRAENCLFLKICETIACKEGWLQSEPTKGDLDLRPVVLKRSIVKGCSFWTIPEFHNNPSKYQMVAESIWNNLKGMEIGKLPSDPWLKELELGLKNENVKQVIKSIFAYTYEQAKKGALKGTLCRLVVDNPYPYSVSIDKTVVVKTLTDEMKWRNTVLYKVVGGEMGIVEYISYLDKPVPFVQLRITGYRGRHIIDGMELITPQGIITPIAIKPLEEHRLPNHRASILKKELALGIDGKYTQIVRSLYQYQFPGVEAHSDPDGVYRHGISLGRPHHGREMDYWYSSRPEEVKSLHLRPSEPDTYIEWETPSISGGKGNIYIDIPVGFGTLWIRKSMKNDYNLYIDGERYVTFNCTKKSKKVWVGKDGVVLTYYALYKDGYGESHGRMLLTIPPTFKRKNSYFVLKVAPAKGGDGNAWFMVHIGAPYLGNNIAELHHKSDFKTTKK